MSYEYKDYENWFGETHKRVSYRELNWIRGRWFVGGMLTMFAILWAIGWLLGL